MCFGKGGEYVCVSVCGKVCLGVCSPKWNVSIGMCV
jgi:hypothetical protein